MTPSERAALVAQIAVALDGRDPVRLDRTYEPEISATRIDRLTREAVAWLAAAEYAVMGEPARHPARPEYCEPCGGAEDDDAQAA